MDNCYFCDENVNGIFISDNQSFYWNYFFFGIEFDLGNCFTVCVPEIYH
jgi:hypothetical protein